MLFAPAIAPAIAAFSPAFESPFPALNCAPPFENWMITGAFNFAAVSSTPLIVSEPVTFTAGSAKPFSLA